MGFEPRRRCQLSGEAYGEGRGGEERDRSGEKKQGQEEEREQRRQGRATSPPPKCVARASLLSPVVFTSCSPQPKAAGCSATWRLRSVRIFSRVGRPSPSLAALGRYNGEVHPPVFGLPWTLGLHLTGSELDEVEHSMMKLGWSESFGVEEFKGPDGKGFLVRMLARPQRGAKDADERRRRYGSGAAP